MSEMRYEYFEHTYNLSGAQRVIVLDNETVDHLTFFLDSELMTFLDNGDAYRWVSFWNEVGIQHPHGSIETFFSLDDALYWAQTSQGHEYWHTANDSFYSQSSSSTPIGYQKKRYNGPPDITPETYEVL